jgi:hypothetical protein
LFISKTAEAGATNTAEALIGKAPDMTAVLSTPVIKTFGSLTITAQVTVDGGYSINVMTGPIREHALCFTTADRALYRRVYRVIAEGGLAGVRPDGIHAALLDTLTGDLQTAMRRRDLGGVA